MVCDTQDLSLSGDVASTTITGADASGIGYGNQNTLDILSGCMQTEIAAEACYNSNNGGYSDWFLPSKDELNEMYLNRNQIGGFSSSCYRALQSILI